MNPILALIAQQKAFNRLVIGLVSLGFVTLIAIGGFGLIVMERNVAYTAWVAHTYDVRQALAEYRILNERLETARRGYLLSRQQRFLDVYTQSAARLPAALDEVRALTSDNPAQQARLGRLADLLQKQLAAGVSSMRAAHDAAAPGEPADFTNDAGVAATRTIRELTVAMDGAEAQLLAQRDAERRSSVRQLLGVAIVGGGVLVLVALGSIWVIVRFTTDLTASRDQLRRLNEGLEDTVRDRTADLQRANDEIQRFAYIVSHDLRSPLVNVMGFTSELEAATAPLFQLLDAAEAQAPQIVTGEARSAVRQDLPEAIGFIRTSTQKMDRLINAILKLSREGRRVLAPEPLDMKRLFEGVAANLRHRTDELGATIEVSPGLPDVVSDRLALEQIFSNLVENAVKYLKPGRPGRIVIGGHSEGMRVIYEVADNGRGIDRRDYERIFDLFRRSGAQDQPGEGIGLAHVRALTYRLGGTIGCESALDQGATFRVSLPARLTEGTAG